MVYSLLVDCFVDIVLSAVAVVVAVQMAVALVAGPVALVAGPVALAADLVALAAGLVASVLAELAWPGTAGTVGTGASPVGAPVLPSFSVGDTDLAAWRG